MPDRVGDLAIVLHSHMPYVEGFGTYPFGEEWLFEAVTSSHLRVLAGARELTLTVTPVLADQLEAPGVPDRMREFVRRHRLEAAERDAADGPPRLREAARAEAGRYGAALAELVELGDGLLDLFARARLDGRVELMASAATHAVLPLLATRAGCRLQIDAGLRSHSRRFGPAGGFWLPECAFRPGLDELLAERGVRWLCLDQSAFEGPLDPLAPVRTAAGPVAFTIDWPTVSLVWSPGGYPADPIYQDYHRTSANGIRLWSIGGRPYDPGAAAARVREHADHFLDSVQGRLEAFASERGRPGLCVFAIDTELLGHWWMEGPDWLAAVIGGASDRGIGLCTLAEALSRHEPDARPLVAATWGEGKDLRTWDSPAVADLTWGARRVEVKLLRELRRAALEPPAAHRAARELLAVQASDWAFLDSRGEAGEYPYQRAVSHAQALFEAIDCAQTPDSRMRSLAPDLSLAPLLEP